MLVNGLRVDNLAREGELRQNVRDPEERAEKAASVYENVGEKEVVGEQRRGEKGEIWYEFGCV